MLSVPDKELELETDLGACIDKDVGIKIKTVFSAEHLLMDQRFAERQRRSRLTAFRMFSASLFLTTTPVDEVIVTSADKLPVATSASTHRHVPAAKTRSSLLPDRTIRRSTAKVKQKDVPS